MFKKCQKQFKILSNRTKNIIENFSMKEKVSFLFLGTKIKTCYIYKDEKHI
jgi:hypothetical protein